MKSFIGRLALVLLLLLLVLVVVQGVRYWQVRRQLQARMRKLQQQNMPIRIEELRPPTLSGGEAIAVLAELEPKLASLGQIMMAIPVAEDGQPDVVAQNRAFRQFRLGHPDLIPRLRDASGLAIGGDVDFGLKYSRFLQSVMEQAGRYRRPTRALSYDAELELTGGSTDEAARDAMAILRWGGHASRQPAIVNHMVAVAIDSVGLSIAARCLAKDDLSPQIRKDLLDHVARVDASAMWTRALISERAFGISSYRESLGAVRHFKSFVADQSHYLDLVEDYLQAGQQPYGTLSLPPVLGATLFATVEPALAQGLKSLRHLQAEQRAVLILAAWQDAGNAEERSIDQLPVPSSMLVDPFDGSQMRLQDAGGRIVIYSVGSNLVDDGGSLSDQLDAGIEVGMDRP